MFDGGEPAVLTRPLAWVALVAVGLAVVIALTWSLLASVPRTVSMNGVVSMQSLKRVIAASEPGTVLAITPAGERVAAGAPVATVQPFSAVNPLQLKSPVDGYVLSQLVSIGEGVQQGQALVTVTSDLPTAGPIVVVAFVGPTQVGMLQPGDSVQVSVPTDAAGNKTVIGGRIAAVDPTPSPRIEVEEEAGAGDVADALVKEAGGIPYRVTVNLEAPASLGSDLRGGQVLSLLVTESSVRPISLLLGN